MDDIYTRFSFAIEQIETEEVNTLTNNDVATKKDIKDIIAEDIGIDHLKLDECNAIKNQIKIVLHELENLKHIYDVYYMLRNFKTKKQDLILHNIEHLEDNNIEEIDTVNIIKHIRDLREERRICKNNAACYSKLNDTLNNTKVSGLETLIDVFQKFVSEDENKLTIEDYKGFLEDANDWECYKKLIKVETENMSEEEMSGIINELKKNYKKMIRYKNNIYAYNSVSNNKKEQII